MEEYNKNKANDKNINNNENKIKTIDNPPTSQLKTYPTKHTISNTTLSHIHTDTENNSPYLSPNEHKRKKLKHDEPKENKEENPNIEENEDSRLTKAIFVIEKNQPIIIKPTRGLDDDGKTICGENTSTSAIIDGGANINIITSKMAAYLLLAKRKYLNPILIRFGQGEIREVTEYVNLGMLGKAAIIDDAPTALISVGAICANGLEVRTNSKQIKIVDEIDGNRVLYKKNISIDGLFYIDLLEFLSKKPPTDIDLYSRTKYLAGSKRDFLKNLTHEYYQENSDNEETDDEGSIINITIQEPTQQDLSNILQYYYISHQIDYTNTIANALQTTDDIEKEENSTHHSPSLDATRYAQKTSRSASRRITRKQIEGVLWLHNA